MLILEACSKKKKSPNLDSTNINKNIESKRGYGRRDNERI